MWYTRPSCSVLARWSYKVQDENIEQYLDIDFTSSAPRKIHLVSCCWCGLYHQMQFSRKQERKKRKNKINVLSSFCETKPAGLCGGEQRIWEI